ncbi:hypothetical protein AAF712_011098 [Marasmius tenuissimus]|uniref:Cytochrome P450 n=1 Tax=Marasmius tenuissimus TaxID=585030 RepID=A0ABR2ZL30_9AGAR
MSSPQLLWQTFLAVSLPCVVWVLLRQWSSRRILNKIPGPRSSSWLKGHINEFFGPKAWDFLEQIRTQYGPTSTIGALWGGKELNIFDPKAMHHILVKDQQIWEEEPSFLTTNALVFGKGLLATAGDLHRKQRKMLNPVFSAAHLRDMTPIFYDVVKRLSDTLTKTVSAGEQEIDVLSWSSRTALELIGQSGLGYSFDPLTDEACAHPYPAALKALLPLMERTAPAQRLLVVHLVKIFPSWLLRLFAVHLPIRDLQELRKLADYMWELSTEIYQGKLRALEAGDEAVHEQMSRGKDIMSVLMNQNMKASDEEKLNEEQLIGQSALARTLHLLSQRPEVQSKLRQELRAAREAQGGENVPYDILVALPYLDAVCRETLRLYGPAPRVTRESTQDAIVPFTTPVRCTDGSVINEITLPARTKVHIDIVNANRNPELWGPDALEWKPERWLASLPSALTEAKVPGIYSHLMTFIGGGRSCIGFKFSQLEMSMYSSSAALSKASTDVTFRWLEVVLFQLVEAFEFRPTDKEIYWESNPVVNPVVKGGPQVAKLPIRIALAK